MNVNPKTKLQQLPPDLDKLLSSKTILITGGTGRLGQAFVRKAVEAGARVYFTYFQQAGEARTLARIGAEGFQLDLADRSAMDRFAGMFKSKVPALDVFIHNAAVSRDGLIQNLSEDDWNYVLNVNLKAPYYLTKELLPVILPPRQPKGAVRKAVPRKIFMVISRMGLSGGYGASLYAAAKGGLIGLAKSLAAELGRRNILVDAINPGFMESRLTEKVPHEAREQCLQESCLTSLSDPGEVAEFIVYLCSDQMTQVTGQVLHFESRRN